MKAVATTIADVQLLEPRVFDDNRGSFFESYNERVLTDLGIVGTFVQDNQSFSRKDVVRGLHYQIKQPQGKLIRCLSGEIFDVAVDLRRQFTHLLQMGRSNPERRAIATCSGSRQASPTVSWSFRMVQKFSTRQPTFTPHSMSEPFSGTTRPYRSNGLTATGPSYPQKTWPAQPWTTPPSTSTSNNPRPEP